MIQYPRIAEVIRDFTDSETTIGAPGPVVAAPGSNTIEATGTRQPGPRSVSSANMTVDELKLLALDYINEDRRLHDLEPVVMGDNSAAQLHADDMVEGRYLGHWWLDGRKPYMVYSEMGGTSYVSENAARTGFSQDEYAELCASADVVCDKVSPSIDIQRLHHAMVYDDAGSQWRHRDNILDPAHRKVNIGIAYVDHFLAFVQHFEGGDVEAPRAPAFSGSELKIRADLVEPGTIIFPIALVHYEPEPQPHTAVEIERFTTYCVGGGFTPECGQPLVQIVPPPQPGTRYLNLPENIIVARSWVVSGGDIEITADLGRFANQPGIYTTSLYADKGNGVSGSLLLQLSTTRG